MFALKRPDLSKIDKNKITKLFESPSKEVSFAIQDTFNPYIYWDKVQYKKPPDDMTAEEFWSLTKFIRDSIKTLTTIKNEQGVFFTWVDLLPGLNEFFHNVDFDTGGYLKIAGTDLDEKKRMQFISRGIVEEAIASSQLEGAHVTRKIAKKMIQEGRKPRTADEKMIFNNYETIKSIEEEYKNNNISMEIILELHKMLTKDTLDDKADEGRWRNDNDKIVVNDGINGEIYHIPPKEDFVKKELGRLIKFANDELGESFLHPIIKAVMLHFWIGYLHPFVDGNGRLARALFYWYLLKKGYWAFGYLPISKIIKNSPTQYGMAYVYSEQDDNDLTYFIDYNIQKIKQAIKEFKEYVAIKAGENKMINKLSKTKYHFNDRQIRLLQYYYDDKDAYTTTKIYMNVYQVSKMTAINDLKKMKRLGFLTAKKQGRNLLYYATDKLEELLR